MPESLSVQIQAGAFGRQYSDDVGVTTETGQPFSPTVAKAWTGTLTTRTDLNTGVVTMDDAGHLITNGSKVMIYWEDDAATHAAGRRRFQSVTAVAGVAVSIDLGAGDDLPTNLTSVILCVMEQIDAVIIGNNIEGIVLSAGAAETNFVFHDNAAAELLYVPLVANSSYVYTSEMGVTNPLAGVTTATIWVGHNNTGAANDCVGAVYFN